MIYIVGSGLSAMAAATALVQRGIVPTVLDAGLVPDPASVALKSRLASTEPSNWRPEDVAQLRRIGPAALNGIPRKLYFGCDFTFRNVETAAQMEVAAASVYRSFATGGFSNLWGAVIEEFSDMQGWPVTREDLTPHYGAVRALIRNHTGNMGTGSGPFEQPGFTAQAQALFADLSAGAAELRNEGIHFAPSRLAIRAGGTDEPEGCRYCGQCLYGCPYDCRYTAAESLARLLRAERIKYIPGIFVQRLSSRNGSVRIEARAVHGGEYCTFSGERVFLAAGWLETTRIVLASLGVYETPVRASHSDIFTFPVVRYHAEPGTRRNNIHTLCQIVADIDDSRISAYPVHLQFYGFNDLYVEILRHRAGRMASVLAPVLRAVAARLFVVFGYLHSGTSSSLTLTLSPEGAGRLRVKGEPNPLAKDAARATARKLLRNRHILRAVAIPRELRMDLPGGGYHSGGTFPMRGAPGLLETDRWGSLQQLAGVHLVDASILPAIPASTIAFTVMANAHRIASACPVPNVE